MMRKIVSMFVVAIFLFGAAVFAGAPAIEGTVVKVTKDSITLKVGTEEKTFTYDKELKFTLNGKRPSSLTVNPGDKATVVADKNNVADKVDIVPQNSQSTGGK